MKLLLILLVGCLSVTASTIDGDDLDIDEEFDWNVSTEDYSFEALNSNNCSSLLNVKFYLYTKTNSTKKERIYATAESIRASSFNSAHPTRIIIHDYYESYLTSVIKLIRRAWLKLGQFNVIVVDWPIARNHFYFNAIMAVPTVGERIADFMEYLAKNHNMLLSTTHVIGHGVGAHVAGYAGKNIKKGQIDTIIGLDPASSTFNYNELSKRLTRMDAFYVETIQTDGNLVGYKEPIGLATFYPNGGLFQPGCKEAICNHKRAAVYYAESIIRDDYRAILCSNYEDFVNRNCGSYHRYMRMGGNKKYLAAGIFYVPVKENSPFSAASSSFKVNKL